jgi:hypothetical protein
MIGIRVSLCFLIAISSQTAFGHALRGEPDLRTHADVQEIESEGSHNKMFGFAFDFIANQFPTPKDELGIDPKVFTGSQNIIVNRALISQDKGPTISNRSGHNFHLKMFTSFYAQLKTTFQTRLLLTETMANALATELERQAIESAQIDYSEYVKFTDRIQLDNDILYPIVLQALEQLYSTSTIIGTCDVPYLAGYDTNDGNLILIDRMIPLYNTFLGQTVPVGKLLNIHERVEKAILDDYQTTYPHAHQIALRLEKLSSDALNAPWKAYDDYITVVSNAMDSRVIDRVYRGLDMAPYLTWNKVADANLVKTMRSAYVDASQCPVSQK